MSFIAKCRHKIRELSPALLRNGSNLRRDSTHKLAGFTVKINDGPNFNNLKRTIFDERIYHFDAIRPDPVILDIGSNIGASVMYFKHTYPRSRVLAFEPDPLISEILQDNIEMNRLSDVQIFNSAIAGREGTLTFYSDGRYQACLADHLPQDAVGDWSRVDVPCRRLRDYLNVPVDFMKMNIEGAEWEALNDAGDQLRSIREMVVEYHHLPGLQRSLHSILSLLNDQGFDYLLNHFDYAINPEVQPPFALSPDSRYYLLVYAKRRE